MFQQRWRTAVCVFVLRVACLNSVGGLQFVLRVACLNSVGGLQFVLRVACLNSVGGLQFVCLCCGAGGGGYSRHNCFK